MPHKSLEAQREYFQANKEAFRRYGLKYYEDNNYDINRRRLLRRIESGAAVRVSSLDKYDIETKVVTDKTKLLV